MTQAHESAPDGTQGGLIAEVTRQMVLLVVVLAVVETAITRAASGARGLRLHVEHPILSTLTAVAETLGTIPGDALFVGAFLLVAAVLPATRWRRSALASGAAIGAFGLSVVLLLARFGSSELPTWLHHATAALLLVAAWRVVGAGGRWRAAGSVVTLVGAAACAAWMGFAARRAPGEAIGFLESAGEALVLAGPTAAWLAGARWKGQGLGHASAAAVALGVAALLVFHRDATMHAVRHLFRVGEAGLPPAVMATLLPLATGALVGLFLRGREARRGACLLLLTLLAARGPGLEVCMLRVAIAVSWLLIAVPAGSQAGARPSGPAAPAPSRS